MSQFDDKPEKYCSWKRSFQNIMKELDATSPEELDLLNKWLGPQSKNQASSLRVANVHDETRGLEKKIWERLDERYGAPESVAASLKERLDRFPKIKNNEYDKLYELADLLSEIDSVKQNERYKLVLAYFDASYGVNEIVTKLPYFMQTRWIDHASKYKLNNSVMYPPFRTFAEFIHSLAVKMNDPSFKFQQTESGKHLAKDCSAKVKCEKCGNSSHCTAFHIERQEPLLDNGGERKKIDEDIPKVGSLCTEICGDANQFNGKSCAKTLLINLYPKGKPEQRVKTYAIIDDQSNRSLATSEFFDTFSEHYDTIQYTLSSCSGKSAQSGRRATGFILESFDRNTQLECTSLIECNDIPNSKQEIATPAVARQYSHLESIAEFIPELDHDANISLLIGRDMISCHHILDQIIGKDHEPYAQRLRLGWTIIGEACLGLVHTSDVITVNKTSVLPNQEITLKPCEYNFKVKDTKLEQKSEYSDIFRTDCRR
ncbi:Hypothetical predicted protein [Mytilus galloprovincialis]|uniref:Peptidase aspartic putative domain-containing protein n=1 Tax=Mytilus galloprovincialis TaxID=29158 RepID=A0A8B6ER07_MYTGA|nr:Hypothetical predicted protein [Mytilus galloprovincialis]